MDSIDVMERLAELLNEAAREGYIIMQDDNCDFYITAEKCPILATVEWESPGRWVGRTA